MPNRKQFQTTIPVEPSLKKLLEEAKDRDVTEEELQEQRISFAYGNAPESDRITKDSVRRSSKQIRLKKED